MKTKTPRVYTLDELKEKSQKAISDPKLFEIVKTAPLNKDGKVNLTWVYGEAEKYVHEQTKDLQKTKELAVAARFLAMLRRNHAEEFEKLISVQGQKETISKSENFFEREFRLPGATIITRMNKTGRGDFSEFSIQFHELPYDKTGDAIDFCLGILSAILEDNDLSYNKWTLGNILIQFLEEKFGLKIKVCGNCKHYLWMLTEEKGQCSYNVPYSYDIKKVNFSDVCEKDWAPKEVLEKPSSA